MSLDDIKRNNKTHNELVTKVLELESRFDQQETELRGVIEIIWDILASNPRIRLPEALQKIIDSSRERKPV